MNTPLVNTDVDDLTTRIDQRLAGTIGPRKYAMWFDRSAQLAYDPAARCLSVTVPSRFVADWIDRHFREELIDAVLQTLGDDAPPRDDIDLAYAVDEGRFEREEVRRSVAHAAPTRPRPAIVAAQADAHDNGHSSGQGPGGPPPPHAVATGGPDNDPWRRSQRLEMLSIPGLRPLRLRHDLEDFVTGPSNELAYAAAEQLAAEDEPGHPLFLHGGCGLGKTHLLQGVCSRLLEHRPDARVLYTTGEQFTNAYITAVRTNKLDAFRKAIRGLDLLAVDDVHFIANKQATQQEFLHSFEQIELTGSRLVLASDQHPKAIEQFSEGLVSRCVRGLVVQLRAPDEPTRRKLAEALAKRRGLVVADAVTEALAQQWVGSIRELEGMLAKLRALASLQHGRFTVPIGRALVDQLFRSDAPDRPRAPARYDAVLEAVVDVTGVTKEAILGRGRQKQVVIARSLLIYVTRRLTTMSYPELATAMGKRNHSTVITADQRMHRQLADHEAVTMPAGDRPMTPRELHDAILRRLGHAG